MYVHWQKRTLRVIIELDEKEAKELEETLRVVPFLFRGDVDIALAKQLRELDISDKRPGI